MTVLGIFVSVQSNLYIRERTFSARPTVLSYFHFQAGPVAYRTLVMDVRDAKPVGKRPMS